MIEDAQQEKIDVIIASDSSRISRKYSDLSNILGKLRESNKVHIITVDNQINTILNDNIIMLNHHAYVHEHEAKAMSQLIKDGIRNKREKSIEEVR